jgi:hypothetical protein
MARLMPRASARSAVDLTRNHMAPPEFVIKAILDGVDETARQMERKWGVGRLRLLVGDVLRIKFDAQKAKLDAAIAADQETYIRAQAEGMRRAWLALDRGGHRGRRRAHSTRSLGVRPALDGGGRQHRAHRDRGPPRRP